jgi:hypothetical protein
MKFDKVHIALIVAIVTLGGVSAALAHMSPSASGYLTLAILAGMLTSFISLFKSSPQANGAFLAMHKNTVDPNVKSTCAKFLGYSGVLVLCLCVASCALFTKIVNVITPASAALVACLDDYVDANPPNVLTITAATLACGSTVEQVIPVLIADLTPADAGAAPTPAAAASAPVVVWHPPSVRMQRLYAIYQDAKAHGLIH